MYGSCLKSCWCWSSYLNGNAVVVFLFFLEGVRDIASLMPMTHGHYDMGKRQAYLQYKAASWMSERVTNHYKKKKTGKGNQKETVNARHSIEVCRNPTCPQSPTPTLKALISICLPEAFREQRGVCPETRLETVTSKPTLPPTPHKLLPFPAPSSFSPALEDSNKREWNQWTLTWTPGPRVALILATGPGGQLQCTINGGRPQRQVLEVCQTVIKGTAGHGLWCYWLCAKVASVTSLCEKLLFRAFWWTPPRHCRLTSFFFKEISYSFEKQNEEKPFACCYNAVLS